MFLTPDITGANPLYKVDNDIRMVITTGQKLSFKSPVFANSLGVSLIATIKDNQVETRVLLKNTDWQIQADDIDYEAMARTRLQEPSFTKQLLKSVTIVKPIVSDTKVNLTYQRLYPLYEKIFLYGGDPVEFTPDVLVHMLDKLAYLEQITAPVPNVQSPTDGSPWLLEPDPDVTRSANIITDEQHEVNVPAKKAFIHPLAGAFFKGTEKLVHATTGVPLVRDVDYVVFGMDAAKTKTSSWKEGVYKYILVIKPHVGPIKVTYHAYGGDVTLYDVRVIEEDLNNVVSFLNASDFLTPQTLAGTAVITNIVSQLQQMRDDMRRLLQSGRPSYGDTTTGSSRLKKITSTDTNKHWWTIAELYKVDGSDDIVIADTMKFRVATLHSKLMFEALVSVNLDNPNTKMDVQILSANYPEGYVPYVDYSGLDQLIMPEFRIIWNQNAVQGSGIYLQIGLPLKGIVEETLVIEDWSGRESCWRLLPEVATAVGPEDSIIPLPNPNHIWDTMNGDSRQESSLIPFPKGHIIWAGAWAMNRPNTGWQHYEPTHLLARDVDIRRIKRLRCDMLEEGGNRYCQYVDFMPGTEDMLGSASFTYNGKPAYINARIRRNAVTGAIEVLLDANITAGLSSNRLDLRHILIYT